MGRESLSSALDLRKNTELQNISQEKILCNQAFARFAFEIVSNLGLYVHADCYLLEVKHNPNTKRM